METTVSSITYVKKVLKVLCLLKTNLIDPLIESTNHSGQNLYFRTSQYVVIIYSHHFSFYVLIRLHSPFRNVENKNNNSLRPMPGARCIRMNCTICGFNVVILLNLIGFFGRQRFDALREHLFNKTCD